MSDKINRLWAEEHRKKAYLGESNWGKIVKVLRGFFISKYDPKIVTKSYVQRASGLFLFLVSFCIFASVLFTFWFWGAPLRLSVPLLGFFWGITIPYSFAGLIEIAEMKQILDKKNPNGDRNA